MFGPPPKVLFRRLVDKTFQKLLLVFQLQGMVPVVRDENCEGRRKCLQLTQLTVPLDDFLNIGPHTSFVGRRVVAEIDDTPAGWKYQE